jgi:hypothetical protein
MDESACGVSIYYEDISRRREIVIVMEATGEKRSNY